MPSNYYSLRIQGGGFWSLSLPGNGQSSDLIDPWSFCRSENVSYMNPICVNIYHDGKIADYNQTAFMATVISARMALAIMEVTNVGYQLIPATISDRTDKWFILNLLQSFDCIDVDKTVYSPLVEAEQETRHILLLKLASHRIPANTHLLRVKGWDVVEVVSEELMLHLKHKGITGVDFDSVS
ncbi:MAG: hypothetical protein QM703_12260 [Gemmatales bacterium]